MKTHAPILTVLGIAALCSLTTTAEAKALTAKQVPQAVHDAFQKAYPAAKGAKFSEETLEGKPAYEVELKDQGKAVAATYRADGTLIETEEAIKTTELPEAVVNTTKQAHPHATVKAAKKVLQPDGTVRGYEVELADGKKPLELALDASGALLKTGAEPDREREK